MHFNNPVNEYKPATSTWHLSYLLTDHLGSVVAVTDGTGALVSQQRYLPFGGERTNPGTISQTDYGYTGQRDNSYIKLMDYHFRWYSPELGRFVSPDNIIPNLSNPQSLNRYSYVVNRPINLNDPTGHDPWWNDSTFYMKEYVEAGIFQQSLGFNLRPRWLLDGTQLAFEKESEMLNWDLGFSVNFDYTGKGPAKVTDPQMKKTYGEEVINLSALSGEGQMGLGLGLKDLDQNDWGSARMAMGRRIAFFLAKVCSTGCSQSDQITVAALAANGDLTVRNYKDLNRAREKKDFDMDTWISSYYGDDQKKQLKYSIPAFKAGYLWNRIKRFSRELGPY